MNTLDRIMDLKNKKVLSDLAFEKEIGLAPRAVAGWKSGKSESFMKILPQLAQYFNVSTDFLLGLSDESNSVRNEEPNMVSVEKNLVMYEKIKNLCEINGISITSLCLEITGSSGNIPTWKKGNIRNDYLVKISKKFNVSTDFLLGITDNSTPLQNNFDNVNPLTRKNMTSIEKKQLSEVLENANALFFDEEISEDDKEKFIRDITEMFWEAKQMNRRKKTE